MASGHRFRRGRAAVPSASPCPWGNPLPGPCGGSPGPGGFPGRQGLSRPMRSCETSRAKRSPSSISVCCRMWRLQRPWGGRPRGTSGPTPGGGVSRGQAPAAAERRAKVSAGGGGGGTGHPLPTGAPGREGAPTHSPCKWPSRLSPERLAASSSRLARYAAPGGSGPTGSGSSSGRLCSPTCQERVGECRAPCVDPILHAQAAPAPRSPPRSPSPPAPAGAGSPGHAALSRLRVGERLPTLTAAHTCAPVHAGVHTPPSHTHGAHPPPA